MRRMRTKDTQGRLGPVLLAVLLLPGLAGCQQLSSTTRRGGAVALGSAVGGLAGHVAGEGKPLAVAGGAVAGAALTHLALGSDAEVEQRGFDQGYLQGQSDSIKRQYFLRQALEAKPLRPERGRDGLYWLPTQETNPDGSRQEPRYLELRIRE